MRLSFSLFLLCTSLFAFEMEPFPVALLKTNPKNVFQLQQNISLVGRSDLTKILRAFVLASPSGRMVGTPGQKVARETLKEMIDKASMGQGTLKIDPFDANIDIAIKRMEDDFQQNVANLYKKTNASYEKGRRFKDSFVSYLNANKGVEGRNFIWEKIGKTHPNEVLMIVAHYDTLGINEKDKVDGKVSSPGADDNGSGVAIALQLIQLFSRMELPRTLKVVFLDWEELGNLGSYAFVKKYQKEFKERKVLGYINLNMLGHDSKTQDQTKKNYNMRSYYRKPGLVHFEKEKKFVEDFLNKGKSVEVRISFTPIGNSFPHSGDLKLWDENLIGATFSQNWEEDFNKDRNHSPNDFVETLNFNTLYSSFRFIAGGVGKLLFSL